MTKEYTFTAKYNIDRLVEFEGDESNTVGVILGITFDNCEQIFYTIQEMDYDENGACYIYESIEESEIVRVLEDDEDFEQIIENLKEREKKEDELS